MSKLVIAFDPTGELEVRPQYLPDHVITATLSVADDLEAVDLYAVARKLAELLLEQVR